MAPALPECSEVAGAEAATADDGVTSTSKRPQQQALIKPWSIAYDGAVPPSTNALATLKSRYPLDPPGFDTAIAKEPVSLWAVALAWTAS